MAVIIIGSFLEGVYLFRWLSYALKLDYQEIPAYQVPWNKILPITFVSIGLYMLGYFATPIASGAVNISFLPLAMVMVIFFLDFLPASLKNVLAISALAYYGYMTMPGLYESESLRFIFSIIFIIGGILTLLAGFAYKDKRKGFYPAALLMYVGLGQLLTADTKPHQNHAGTNGRMDGIQRLPIPG
ncbi:MAG: hypothetical protein ACOC59_02430 [Bacteroidota bacterium]